jgi:hypothetical protein
MANVSLVFHREIGGASSPLGRGQLGDEMGGLGAPVIEPSKHQPP